MTITASHAPAPGTPPAPSAAEAIARTRLAEIRRTLAEDRAARHQGVISLSTGRPVLADPPSAAPSPVNFHPGPDFDWTGEAA